jgi:hypothetical protein
MSLFAAFSRELSIHSEGRYHRAHGPISSEAVATWFERCAPGAPAIYRQFLTEIGSGRFFGGNLSLYPITATEERSIASELKALQQIGKSQLLPIGYDGTTEGEYCLSLVPGDSAVYWFSWETTEVSRIAEDVLEWIESRPADLSDPEAYADAHRRLSVSPEIVAVFAQRAAFAVRLVGFEKVLQRPPEKPGDLLPRYNQVIFEVTKLREAKLSLLTVGLARAGSQYGADNVVYVSLPIADVPLREPVKIVEYVFDPFNVPFEEIELLFTPEIDLSSKSRARFKEIESLVVSHP